MYSVKEVFASIQGEGVWTGQLSTFVRFAGCNVWTGREEDRQTCSLKGVCAAHCDTDFVGTDGANGGKYNGGDLLQMLRLVSSHRGHLILTGGEPGLQVDDTLLMQLQANQFRVHIETNGSIKLPRNSDIWVTLSPKPPMPVVDQLYDEVKVLFPLVDPLVYESRANHKFVQPVALGGAAYTEESVRACLQFIQLHPVWRLSPQVHKLLRLP